MAGNFNGALNKVVLDRYKERLKKESPTGKKSNNPFTLINPALPDGIFAN
jgi:hypothetical protein